MSKFRESLIDRMIAIYGMEHPAVIEFAQLCESYADTPHMDWCLMVLLDSHERQHNM